MLKARHIKKCRIAQVDKGGLEVANNCTNHTICRQNIQLQKRNTVDKRPSDKILETYPHSSIFDLLIIRID